MGVFCLCFFLYVCVYSGATICVRCKDVSVYFYFKLLPFISCKAVKPRRLKGVTEYQGIRDIIKDQEQQKRDQEDTGYVYVSVFVFTCVWIYANLCALCVCVLV